MLDICLPGTGGTMPLKSRWLSSAIMRYNGSCLLIDSGEGAQLAIKQAGFTFKPIDVICYTHFHADHISGLPGLLLTMGNEGRIEPVTVLGPKGLVKVVGALRTIAPELPFRINLVEINENTEEFKFGNFEITAFKVKHTIHCYGYSIRIRRIGKFDPEKAKANNVPMRVWSALQKNPNALLDGILYTKDMILGPERKGIKVTYCTDTRPVYTIAENAKDSDLFVCEGMFDSSEKHERAFLSGHMTMTDAAKIALEAKPKKMWLTHFSPSLPDPFNYIDDVKQIFPNSECGYDGIKSTIMFED